MTSEISYLRETIQLLDTAIKPETILNDEDYMMIALRILKCDANLMHNEKLKKLVHIGIDMDKFTKLTHDFYNKMKNGMGED